MWRQSDVNSRLVLAALVGLLVTGCASTSSPSGAPGPATPGAVVSSVGPDTVLPGGGFARELRLDDGALQVSPSSKKPSVPRVDAARTLASTWPGHASGQTYAFGFGRVTVDPTLTKDKTAAFRNRLAWVAVLGGFSSSCPAAPVPTGTPSSAPLSPSGPAYTVLVLDGQHGTQGLEYSTRQPPLCGGPVSGPSAGPLVVRRSLTWHLVRMSTATALVRVDVSPCTQVNGGSGQGSDANHVEVLTVLGDQTLGSGHCSSARSEDVHEHLLPGITALRHGPTGPYLPPTGAAGAGILHAAGRHS